MELLDMARELGIALAGSEEFVRMKAAQSAITKSEAFSGLLEELQEKQAQLTKILGDNAQDASEAIPLTNDIERLQGQLRENPLYLELSESQNAFSALVIAVDDEINACIGHPKSTCSGECGGCGGCAH